MNAIALGVVVLVFTSLGQAQTSYDILHTEQVTNPTYGTYVEQAAKVVHYFPIDAHNIPCPVIDKIDIYGNGDGIINPHYAVPAASHDEWKHARYKFTDSFKNDNCGGVLEINRVYFDGKCAARSASTNQIKGKVYCTSEDAVSSIAAGRKAKSSANDDTQAKDDYIYPDYIFYKNAKDEPLSYARECKSSQITHSQVRLRVNSDTDAGGITCYSNGKQEITPNDIQLALGKSLISDFISSHSWSSDSKNKNPFYDASIFGASVTGGATPNSQGDGRR